jgi:putative ABC transport system ATP-binding protein
MIELFEIHKAYPVGPTMVPVLNGISMTIGGGELVSIMGSSGSGKSTLMNIIGMLDWPTSGQYRLNGRDILAAGSDDLADLRNELVGFVFQSFFLLPRLTALENVTLPLFYRGTDEEEARAKAVGLLERVGMGSRLQARPMEMSGGQRQRVAIARALVGDPALVLADEPTGALDTKVGQEIMDLFIELNRERGITVVIITHDPGIAAQCRRRVLMRDGLLADYRGEFGERHGAPATAARA